MPSLCQVALSVLDPARSARFYETLGLMPAGGMGWIRGPVAERVQGIPGARATCRWLIDDGPFFQLEIFAFERPEPSPQPDDRNAADLGYNRLAIRLPDLGGALKRLSEQGFSPIAEPTDVDGRPCAALRDPDGVIVELLQADERGVRVLGIGISVETLEIGARLLCDELGLRAVDAVSERESLWGLEGASREALRLEVDGRWVELCRYESPRPRPRRDGALLSDQGIMNIAFGCRSRGAFRRMRLRLVRAGCRPNLRAELGLLSSVYLTDPQGLSLELLYCSPRGDAFFGFRPPPPWARALMADPTRHSPAIPKT